MKPFGKFIFVLCGILFLLNFKQARAQESGRREQSVPGAQEGVPYQYPIHFLPLRLYHEDVRMAYMDVPPVGSGNGNTVVLLHGKNFSGEYWRNTVEVLRRAGYRVVVPDQVGFGRSSKPTGRYSFHEMALQTKLLLDQLQVKHVAVVGHSMGGMLGTRFALMYPDMVTRLILENPIGLEDYREKVPFRDVQRLYQENLNTSEEKIRNYFQTYFVTWKPEYEKYVLAQYAPSATGEFPRYAMVSALTEEMIYEQPVCYEFRLLKPKTLLIIGQADRTTIGRSRVSPEVLKTLGNYPGLGKKVAGEIPQGGLVEIPDCGHIPHLEKPEVFHRELLAFLSQ